MINPFGQPRKISKPDPLIASITFRNEKIMPPDVMAAAAFFDERIVRLNPAARESDLAKLERELKTELPPSMRRSLMVHDGGRIAHVSIYAASPSSLRGTEDKQWLIAGETDRWNAKIRFCRESFQQHGLPLPRRLPPDNILAVADRGTADVYVLMLNYRSSDKECPVALIDHETLEVMAVVASSYERLLWFLITDLQREIDKTGRDKPDRLIQEAKWPFDRDWTLRQDPDLSQWSNIY